MALKAHEREVLYADIIVKRRAEQAPYPPLSSLVSLWQKARDTKLSPKTFEAGTVTAIIGDYRVDLASQTLTLLVSVADPNASDPTFANHVKRSSRTVAKGPDEGHEYSAHIVISLIERKGIPNAYPCLIERVPTLSGPRLQSILNDVISRYCAQDQTLFTYKAAGGQKVAKPYLPHVDVSLLASEQFENDIETGTVSGLKFTKPAASSAGTALGKFLTTTDYSLNVKVSKDIPAGKRLETIMKGIRAQASAYPKAVVYLKPMGAASSSSVAFDTQTGNLLGEAYTRKRRIGPLDPLLRNGSETIVTHLEAKMVKLLLAER